ncbi:hypothetical protein [Bacillus sp. FSL K6-3431]|uniref:hypothetical protein n=1 Tax=Bacillus sp. FSL K6-3431 TaxID=2921500 RepID=UPI0030F65349
MKITLILISSFLVVAASFFLYQKSLGSIPFLLISFVLFYLGRRKPPESKSENDENVTEKA